MPFLPAGYPEKLYPKEAGVSTTKRKHFTLSVHSDLKKVIQHFASLLPAEIFTDGNIFPADPAVLLKLAQAIAPDPHIKMWYSGDFSLVRADGLLELRRAMGSGEVVVCKGDSAHLFEYILRYCESALPAFVYTHRQGFIAHPRGLGEFCNQLRSFRLTRRISSGLDRCSKVDEMTYVDQDSTYYKFPAIHYWRGNRQVWHLGSGSIRSTSQRALSHYERVVCIDPILEAEGPDHWKRTWQDVLPTIPPGCDVVSDVAFGDEFGLVGIGMFSLAKKLYELSGSRLVMVKLTLEIDYPGIEGFIVSKVRPHNAEFVAVLEPGAGLLDDLLPGMRQKAIEANEKRNQRIYCLSFPDVVKPTRTSSEELGHLMRWNKPKLPVSPRRVAPTVDRTKLFCTTLGTSPGSRHERWKQVCKQKNIPKGAHLILPHAFVFNAGPISGMDPGFNCPYISFRSVVQTAAQQHLAAVYKSGEWHLVTRTRNSTLPPSMTFEEADSSSHSD